MINTAIAKLAAGQNLAGTETREAFNQIMSGGASPDCGFYYRHAHER